MVGRTDSGSGARGHVEGGVGIGRLTLYGARRLPAALFEALLPSPCVSCGATVESCRTPLCGVCEARLTAAPAPHCGRCGITCLPDLATSAGCGECQDWPAALRRARSAFLLQPPAESMVHGLKYRGWTSLAAHMGELMVPAALQIHPGTGTAVLVPVPLARPRLRERGYNQAALLAASLGRALNWPVQPLLERTRQGRRQVRSGRSARAENVAGVYRLAPRKGSNKPLPSVHGLRPIVLVDDVITTGSTLAACAAALDTVGVACAGAVSFARTPPRVPGE